MLRTLTVVVVAGCLSLAAAPAGASPQTIKRSVENLTQAPIDIAASPVVSGVTIYRNITNIGDTLAVRIFYPIPGFAWNTMVNIGAGVLRGVTGVMEFVPGLILIPFDADIDPLFDPAEDNEGLVHWENGIYDVNAAIDYTTAGGS
ncbi:MAG TPA: hypothetical protein VNE71_10670 [Myxococcota bacterium]|nr:hypothetical protein [Myxococcota bacterium]